jgi:hypothetical protein
MRNDARPIGEDASGQSPVPSHPASHDPGEPAPDRRDRVVSHDRRTHVVNRQSDDNLRRKDTDIDPVMPAGDATLKTKI